MGVSISSHKGAANWRIAAGGALAINDLVHDYLNP